MRKFFAVAMGSLVALAGFAGVANASSTIDLVWIDVSELTSAGAPGQCLTPARRDCPIIGSTIGVSPSTVLVSDSITLGVIITAGSLGTSGGGLSVDYTEAIPATAVTGFRSLLSKKPVNWYLPLTLGTTTDTGAFIDNINAGASIALGNGFGLPAGASTYLGTVTFHQDVLVNGTFEITAGVNGPGGTDGLLDNDPTTPLPLVGAVFNSALLINVPEPGALSLLVMGVGGMLLAGRGRRS
jgi:hypothetical protein